MKPTPYNAFLCGVAMDMGLTMAVQNWMGLEVYIARCQESWVDMPWTVGGGIALLALWGFVSINGKYIRAKQSR
jgi:hypothetical protein